MVKKVVSDPKGMDPNRGYFTLICADGKARIRPPALRTLMIELFAEANISPIAEGPVMSFPNGLSIKLHKPLPVGEDFRFDRPYAILRHPSNPHQPPFVTSDSGNRLCPMGVIEIWDTDIAGEEPAHEYCVAWRGVTELDIRQVVKAIITSEGLPPGYEVKPFAHGVWTLAPRLDGKRVVLGFRKKGSRRMRPMKYDWPTLRVGEAVQVIGSPLAAVRGSFDRWAAKNQSRWRVEMECASLEPPVIVVERIA
jgi:hypothetical protein